MPLAALYIFSEAGGSVPYDDHYSFWDCQGIIIVLGRILVHINGNYL